MIEDFEETKVSDVEGIEEDEELSTEIAATKKDKETRINNMLVQATQTHELLVQLFWKTHLRKEGKTLFRCDCDASD